MYHFLGRHAGKAAGVASFSTLLCGVLNLLLGAVGKVSWVGVAGHCG